MYIIILLLDLFILSAAHWPQFAAATVAYIREREDFKSGDWNEDTKKLIAFLMGMNIHYMADETWEGVNNQLLGEGFVETINGNKFYLYSLYLSIMLIITLFLRL